MSKKYNYKIFNDLVYWYLSYRGKVFEVIFDKNNLEKIINFKYRWHVKRYNQIDGYYVEATEYLGTLFGKPQYKTVLLHRFLLNASEEEVIDHKNHNPLDYRISNLRKCSDLLNLKNRRKKNSNNTSGYRNVTWMSGYWRVQVQVNGKNKIFDEKFEDVDLAGEFAEEMRKKYYGEYAGKN